MNTQLQNAVGTEMENAGYDEKREFLRVDHEAPLEFRMLNSEKLSSKRNVISRNLSASGLLFRTNTESSIPAISGLVWIKLSDRMLNICNEIESDLVQIEGGVLGRVVRISEGESDISYDIGVSFLRKKNMSNEDLTALTRGIEF